MAPTPQPGDFVLGRARGPRHAVLALGQALRLPAEHRHYADYTHAALVTSFHGGLIEAVGGGVRSSTLSEYSGGTCQVVRITASAEERRRVVDFAERALAAKAPYGVLAVVSNVWWAATGLRPVIYMDGTYTCSGLVASALEQAGARFDRAAALVVPAQLAIAFAVDIQPTSCMLGM